MDVGPYFLVLARSISDWSQLALIVREEKTHEQPERIITTIHMRMIVSVKDQNDRQYGVYVMVPEEVVESLLERGVKPKEFLTILIEKIYSDNDFETLFAYAYNKAESLFSKRGRKQIQPRPGLWSEWSYSAFDEFMKRLLLLIDSNPADKDLLSFLIAFHKLGPRPTSEMLRKAMSIEPGDVWYERLRVMKARLTILAKHMRLTSFFLRAYGSGMMRKHPIEIRFYDFIQEWLRKNSVILGKYNTNDV